MSAIDERVRVAEERHARHLGAHRLDELRGAGLDVVVGAREGARFQDLRSGRWLWNCHANGGTYNLGHRPPQVVDALVAALRTLDIGNHHLLSPTRARAAEALAGLTGGRLPGVVLTASGSEANEVALRIARLYRGRDRVVVTDGCYHGTTRETMAANVALAQRYRCAQPEVVSVPWDDVAAMEAAVDERTALVMLEAVPATAGFPMPGAGYLAAVRDRCDRTGALLLVDEVQTGLGRTGRMWSHEHDGITPDLLVVGKGLSAGLYPVAATLIAEPVKAWFDGQERLHSSTFGGAELGCVVAEAVASVVSADGFLDHVGALAAQFADGLTGGPFELRRRGLVMALRVPGQSHHRTWSALRERGVFTMPALFTDDVVQFKPPLTLTHDEAAQIVDAVRGALG